MVNSLAKVVEWMALVEKTLWFPYKKKTTKNWESIQKWVYFLISFLMLKVSLSLRSKKINILFIYSKSSRSAI